jgi:hypothetical protein
VLWLLHHIPTFRDFLSLVRNSHTILASQIFICPADEDYGANLYKQNCQFTHTIETNLTGNPSYPTPNPTLPGVTTTLNEFTSALADPASGGITLTAIKNDKRAALVALLLTSPRMWRVTYNGDLTVLLSSGFPIETAA